MLCRFAGLTQREAADVLGMKTGAAVGQQLQRRMDASSRLRRHVGGIEQALTNRGQP